MSPTTRVFIVAPSPVVRAGLRSMLASAAGDGVEVVGEAASLDEEVPSGLDVFLLAGEEAAEEASSLAEAPGAAGAALLALSDDEGLAGRLRVLPSRAWGLVSPEAAPEELEAALLAVGQGLVVLPAPVAEHLIETPVAAGELSEPLTAREGEVLEAIGRGLSNKMIARELRISEHTVKFHVSSLYAKLGVASRTEAIGQGARLGLISL